MATAIRQIGHEDRLSLVDHLDELRTRLIVSALALAVAFGVCFWQNHALLGLVNHPEQAQTRHQVAKGQGIIGKIYTNQQATIKLAGETSQLAKELSSPASKLPAQFRARLRARANDLAASAAKLPKNAPGDQLVTVGIGEPFTTTVAVTFVFALIISLPVILYELYGFVIPALDPKERKAVRPVITAIPFLFVSGVLFGYFVVLPAAVHFFVNFNSGEFLVLVQAGQYYKFAATVLLAMGLIFQVPAAVVGASSAGLVTPRQLRKGRRYAVVVCAAVAAFIPGDAITLALETIPLYLLYELSILAASFVLRRSAAKERAAGTNSPQGPPPASAGHAPGPTAPQASQEMSVSDIIDHIDRELSD